MSENRNNKKYIGGGDKDLTSPGQYNKQPLERSQIRGLQSGNSDVVKGYPSETQIFLLNASTSGDTVKAHSLGSAPSYVEFTMTYGSSGVQTFSNGYIDKDGGIGCVYSSYPNGGYTTGIYCMYHKESTISGRRTATMDSDNITITNAPAGSSFRNVFVIMKIYK